MGLGQLGIYVLEARLTRVDGRPFTGKRTPKIGQTWRWSGEAVRLDGPSSTLLLSRAVGGSDFTRRMSRIVRQKLGASLAETPWQRDLGFSDSLGDGEAGFVVADGETRFRIVPVQSERRLLIWCPDGVPLRDTDYRIVSAPPEVKIRQTNDFGGDVICFTQGTRIRGADRDFLVEDLVAGDKVQTKDNGVKEILWVGERKMSGARLFAMPDLRPIRVRASAIDADIPDSDLLVSPHHRMLIEGVDAEALFNQSEVLVSARDMIDDVNVFVDHSVREVTYIHLLLEDHNILWANGLMTESYHPANTTLATVEADQRARLLDMFPDLSRDLHSYGPFARRNLSRSEAAILRHAQA